MKQDYRISPKDLISLITAALNVKSKDFTSDQKLHKYLSQSWVKNFALGMERYYSSQPMKILSFYNQRDLSDKQTPPVKEFLFDITVAKCDSFYTSRSKNLIPFITEPIWQIESEFKPNMREIVKDFQKLISGNAQFKMMIVPYGKDGSKYFKTDTAHLAKYVNGELWLVAIQHPSAEWYSGTIKFEIYKWDTNKSIWLRV